ncbi:hypothetical protein [Peribacillus muralis]|nr:hypothetical protein [Peribacillus muralis]
MVKDSGISEGLKPGNLGAIILDPGDLGGSPLSLDPGNVGA